MVYWAVARLVPQHEAYGLHCLNVAGFEAYYPRLRARRTRHGRTVEIHPPLFQGYCFIVIRLQWHRARWSPGVSNIITGGDGSPSRVPDNVITDLKSREKNGLIELPKPPGLHVGDRVKIRSGPFAGHLALFEGMKPRERVEILLSFLGSQQKVVLPKSSIEPILR
jgi:transcriptional antiterminator RfaH